MAEQKSLLEGAEGPPDELRPELYRTARTARRLDGALQRAQRRGEISLAVPARGEEVLEVTATAALDPEDWIFPGLRATGVFLQRGMSLEDMAHQAYGTSRDPAGGRNLPGFVSWKEGRIVSVSPSLGAAVAQATGLAWALAMRREPRVVLTLFGDGTVSQPDFHTGLNFAGVRRAPAVFLWKSADRGGAPGSTVQDRARAYGIHGCRVEGTSMDQVWDACRRAADRAREGDGPTLVRAVLPAPVLSAGGNGRPSDAGSDSLDSLRRSLVERGQWSEDREEELEEELDQALRAAFEAARKAPRPAPGEIFEQVYESTPSHLKDQGSLLSGRSGEGP